METDMNMDLKELWNRQYVPSADSSVLKKKIGHFRKGRIKKLLVLNTILLLTISLIVFIWVYFEPQFVSTKIGIVLTIIPIGVVVAYNFRLLPLYKRVDERHSNFDYLNDLLVVKSKEGYLYTKIMNLYFVFLSAGIGLYMYEYIQNKSLIFAIFAYSSFLLWIAFNWFFLRPRSIKRHRQKMEQLINQVEKIKLQMNKP